MRSSRPRLPPVEALSALAVEALAELRSRLREGGYGDELVAEAERVAPRQFDAVRLPLVHAWLARRGGPSATLAALFSYEAEVPREDARAALGEHLLAALADAGVLAPSRDGLLVARYRITPLAGLWLVSDPPHGGPETVMGPGPTTVVLVDLLPERAGDVLDVGCGAGTLALVAASRGARRAVGVDLSPRAIALACVNARLNQLEAEFRVGDLLAPVRGERFDLVVSQPPYVALPPGMQPTAYLHGGARGDELALRFAAEMPDAMKEGGTALLHFDSPELPGHTLAARLREVLPSLEMDVAVLTSAGPSPDLQAAAFGAIEDPTLGPEYRAAARTYRQHLERSGVESICRAVAVLHRRSASAPGFVAQIPVRLERLDPGTVARLLRGLEMAGAPDDQLLGSRVRLAPGARLAEERPLSSAGPSATIVLRFDGGVATDLELSEGSRVLAEVLDGSASVSEVVDSYARACDAPREAVLALVLSAVREGLARGAFDCED